MVKLRASGCVNSALKAQHRLACASDVGSGRRPWQPCQRESIHAETVIPRKSVLAARLNPEPVVAGRKVNRTQRAATACQHHRRIGVHGSSEELLVQVKPEHAEVWSLGRVKIYL